MFIDQSPIFEKVLVTLSYTIPNPPNDQKWMGVQDISKDHPRVQENPLHGDQEMSFPSDFLWSSKWTPTTPEGDASSRSACIALRS